LTLRKPGAREEEHLTLKRALAALALALLATGSFVFGFASCLHLSSSEPGDVRRRHLLEQGDAPPLVRAGVLTALRAFQDGYVRRDPNELDSFMRGLFPEGGDVLLLGTDAAEWVRGYRAVGNFIQEDWRHWGDFRFDTDRAIVWCSGDVAWIASAGLVRDGQSGRAVRFSAVLTRDRDRWLFRQLQFQWDDRAPGLSVLRHASTYGELARWTLAKVLRLPGMVR
jgi:SnoaL-like protein